MLFYKQHFILLLIVFFMSACHFQMDVTNHQTCSYSNLNYIGQNTFCSSPRTSLVHNNQLLIAFDNGNIIKWDTNTTKVKSIFNTNSDYTVRTLLDINNTIWAGSGDMSISQYTSEGMLLQQQKYNNGSIFNIKLFENNLYIAFGNASLGIYNLNHNSLQHQYKQHQYLIYSILIDKQNRILFTGSDDNTIIKWHIMNNGNLQFINHIHKFSSAVKHIIKIDASKYIVTTSKGKIFLYDKNFNKLLSTIDQKIKIISLAYLNNLLIVGDTANSYHVYKVLKNKLIEKEHNKLSNFIRIIQPINKDQILIIDKNGMSNLLNTKSIK